MGVIPACELIPLQSTADWLSALEGVVHGFGHRPEYVAAASLVTGHESALWVCRGSNGTAVCPVALRASPGGGSDVVTPVGFAGFAIAGELPELADAWTGDWKGRGVVAAYVQLSPLAPPERWRIQLGALSAWLFPGPECWAWDLARDEDELLGNMTSKHRQLLRKWLRQAPGICWDGDQLRPRFKSLYADFVRRRGIGSAYHYADEALDLLFDAPGTFLVGARGADGEIEAITLFLWQGGQGESFLNAATPSGRAHSRGLYWLGALRLRELGVRVLNLGGGVGNGDALSEFKQRLGARRAPSLVLRQVVDLDGYRRACAAAGVAENAQGRFPPWLHPDAGSAGFADPDLLF